MDIKDEKELLLTKFTSKIFSEVGWLVNTCPNERLGTLVGRPATKTPFTSEREDTGGRSFPDPPCAKGGEGTEGGVNNGASIAVWGAAREAPLAGAT